MAEADKTGDNPRSYSSVRAAVIRHFLRIYRQQIDAPLWAKSEIRRIPVASAAPNYLTFELRIEHQGEWATRRMTIAPLGEESGSRSICFYVIYDDHLVVKIPPSPITDLNQYVESIHAEQKIVFRLDPRACVVPGVAVILKRLHSFQGESVISGNLEGKYISWLKKNPEFQEYLKIDDAFAFFMDLTKHRILGDVLNKMHQEKDDQVREEIVQGRGIIQEVHNFEGRYGKKNSSICFDLQSMYKDYDAGVQAVFEDTRADTRPYKTEEWFLSRLAGQALTEDEADIPAETIAGLNQLLARLSSDHQETVNSFRTMVYEYVGKNFFSKKKIQMEGIVANMLDLLAWLKLKGVAMRDLKPDNLIVTGDPEANPNFLSSPDQYDLGLIDVETAVIYEPPNQTGIEQPQLGGTPVYSTPSQLFSNKALGNAFDDLQKVFWLQDWYAAIGSIYEVVTGERLFEQTAGKLQAVMKGIQQFDAKKQTISQFMKEANTLFWKGAVSEFRVKMKRNEKNLKYLVMSLPESGKEMLLDGLRDERRHLSQAIKAQAASLSNVLPDGEKEHLEGHKKELEVLDRSIRALNGETGEISVYEVIEIMFAVVFKTMGKTQSRAA